MSGAVIQLDADESLTLLGVASSSLVGASFIFDVV